MLVAALSVLFLYGAVGMLFATWIASPPTGPGYWRLLLLLVVAGAALGLGLRLSDLEQVLPPIGAPSLVLIAVGAIALVAFGIRKGLDPERGYPVLLGVSGLAATGGLLADPALHSARAQGVAGVLYTAGLVSTALVLGSVLVAMILAHWYLIQPRMPIAPLQRVILLFVGAELVKLPLLVGIVALHYPGWAAGEGGLLRAFVLGDALFVAVRAVLGVLSPLGLAWMTWKTVQIRSIQSATGILYAAIVFVLFGEVISVYLSLSTGQPF